MSYPFPPKLKSLSQTSYQLKILSVIWNKPITKVISTLVKLAYDVSNEEELRQAIEEIGIFKEEGC